MNEAGLWKWLKPRLPQPGDYTRIESECSPGIPDVSAFVPDSSGDFWIELKASPGGRYPFKTRRGRNARERGLRATQRVWMHDRVQLGCRVFIIAAVGSQLGIWIVTTALIGRFNGLSIDELAKSAVEWHPRRSVRKIPPDWFPPF